MKSKRPSSLTVPSVEAHPFITVVNTILPLGFKHRVDDRYFPDLSGDADFTTDHFETPACVQTKSLAPISALSDETFNRLCFILGPKFLDEKILSKTDMATAAIKTASRFDKEDGDFTLEQLQGYIMHHALILDHVRWADLAELYNGSKPNQQEALYQFFIRCRNRDLSVLMDVPAPELKVPGSVAEEFETRQVDGETFLFSDIQQKWLRDDVFYQQYQIVAQLTNTKSTYLLGTAPTLKQALSKATAYGLKAKGGLVTDYMFIRTNNVSIAKAGFLYIDKSDLMAMLTSHVRLRWNLEFGKHQTEALEIKLKALNASMTLATDLRVVEQLQAQADEIQTNIDDMNIPKKEDLRRLIFSVEKAFDLQWTKVAELEDDFGM